MYGIKYYYYYLLTLQPSHHLWHIILMNVILTKCVLHLLDLIIKICNVKRTSVVYMCKNYFQSTAHRIIIIYIIYISLGRYKYIQHDKIGSSWRPLCRKRRYKLPCKLDIIMVAHSRSGTRSLGNNTTAFISVLYIYVTIW